MTPEERIVIFIDHLKDNGHVKFKEEIYNTIGMRRQEYDYAKKGKRRITSEVIQSLCKNYDVNANWIFGTETNMWRTPKSTLFTDKTNKTTKQNA